MTLLEIAGDALRIFLGAVFLWYGYFNLRPSPARKDEFRHWGFAPWVQPAGGALQLVAVALLVLPATVSYGAVLLVAMMIFSIYTHLRREHAPHQVPVPLVLAALALLAAYLYGGAAAGPVGEVFRAWFH